MLHGLRRSAVCRSLYAKARKKAPHEKQGFRLSKNAVCRQNNRFPPKTLRVSGRRKAQGNRPFSGDPFRRTCRRSRNKTSGGFDPRIPQGLWGQAEAPHEKQGFLRFVALSLCVIRPGYSVRSRSARSPHKRNTRCCPSGTSVSRQAGGESRCRAAAPLRFRRARRIPDTLRSRSLRG